MNAPITQPADFAHDTRIPPRLRAHLLHRLSTAFSPPSLRAVSGSEDSPLARSYWQRAMGNALQDFLGRHSKMIRAEMLHWAWKAAGGTGAGPTTLSLAVEALHAGSLIIDDIEDDAKTRRGDKALHLRYGLAPALNAGNWLYFWPIQLIGEAGLMPERELAALKQLGETQYRCHMGQGLDVSLKIADVRQEHVREVTTSKTRMKTGSLMGLATYLGALAADADLETCRRFAQFGESVGMTLQMLDDTGTISREDRGEKAREDLMTGTPTWPWAWAADSVSPNAYQELLNFSHDVQSGHLDYTFLRARLRQTIPTDATDRLRNAIEKALVDIQSDVQCPQALAQLRASFERMCQSYV